MLEQVKQLARRASNRINNILSRGIMTDIASDKKIPTATVKLFKNETYAGIEYPQDWGFISSPPKVGTEAIVAFFGGQRDHGTILRAFNRDNSLKAKSSLELAEGECALYNKVTNTYILLKADGTILIKSDAAEGVQIDAAKLKVTGDLFVEGDVLDNSDTNSNTVSDMRDIYNAHIHPTPAGPSDVPTTEM